MSEVNKKKSRSMSDWKYAIWFKETNVIGKKNWCISFLYLLSRLEYTPIRRWFVVIILAEIVSET